jgi:hypothetical protein
MRLVEVYVNDKPVAGQYLAQAFFEHEGREYEMSVQAGSREEAEALAQSQVEAYLAEWAVDEIAANQKYGVYLF